MLSNPMSIENLKLQASIKEKLNRNSLAACSFSLCHETLKFCVKSILKHRERLLSAASATDEVLHRKGLASTLFQRPLFFLPSKTRQNVGKRESVNLMVDF